MTVHSSAEIEACRSRWIEGSATFTTVLSSMIMNSAKHIAASVHQRRLGPAPLAGEGHALAAAVGRVLLARDELALHEPVHRAADRGEGREAELVAEGLDRERGLVR